MEGVQHTQSQYSAGRREKVQEEKKKDMLFERKQYFPLSYLLKLMEIGQRGKR